MTERHYGRYSLEPRDVPLVETEHRRIQTKIPVPESVPVFERMQRFEPTSMHCMPPLLWDHAEGDKVFDRFGNRWIDWSSCVLVANAGHAHPKIVSRVGELVDRKQLSTYVFAHEERAELAEKLTQASPDGLDRVFLLTTGSEAVECAIKLMRTWGRRQSDTKRTIVSFSGSFHGRTLGSQLAGGIPALKTWIGGDGAAFVQVPFPDGYLQEDDSFEVFLETLRNAGVEPSDVAGVISETYQGIGPDFFPTEYAQSLRSWCDEHGALLCFDEVQAGFGRTGKFFAFEHYGVTPDLISCGKGISSSLPLAAVIGRDDVLQQYPPGSMTSTHSGSPLSCAAGIASLEALKEDRLVERAAELEEVLNARQAKIESSFSKHVGCVRGRGLVGGIRLVQPGTKEPDSELAYAITERCFQSGLLLFSPVGLGGGCLKIAPPLCTTESALNEGFDVLTDAFERSLEVQG
ncbi:MAG: aspartate aminotransferase family protein [Planctomycetota bacterium]